MPPATLDSYKNNAVTVNVTQPFSQKCAFSSAASAVQIRKILQLCVVHSGRPPSLSAISAPLRLCVQNQAVGQPDAIRLRLRCAKPLRLCILKGTAIASRQPASPLLVEGSARRIPTWLRRKPQRRDRRVRETQRRRGAEDAEKNTFHPFAFRQPAFSLLAVLPIFPSLPLSLA
jgi:hypothetical protein